MTATTRTARKLGLLGSLYFSQGLPFGFFTQALPVMLRERGVSLGAIGLSSLLAVPWALKFLWAPAVDRYGSPRWGMRRSWILPLQIASAVVLAALALVDSGSLSLLMGAVLLLNLVAATQDIATDGLAVDMLARHERGYGNGVQVAGYRVGMILGGGLLLLLFDRLGARGSFAAMALATAVATLPVALWREPQRSQEPQRSPSRSTEEPRARPLWRRPGGARVLLLVVVYKAGDAFAVAMLRPFLADAGLSLADVGRLLGTVGFVAGLVGALLGGALVGRLGRKRALLFFGLLQALTVAGYAYLAWRTPSPSALYLICAAEHLAGGMATAALFTFMMDRCAPGSGATDYTLQASAVVVATGIAASLAGFSAAAFGYLTHFGLAATLAVLGLGVVAWAFPRQTIPSPAALPLVAAP
ncbi:MAG: MFS transporter [Polyangiaceae bacterium]